MNRFLKKYINEDELDRVWPLFFLAGCLLVVFLPGLFHPEFFSSEGYRTFLAAISGGVVGGIGSFYGGLTGAERSYKLMANAKQIDVDNLVARNHELLISQIKYSYKKLTTHSPTDTLVIVRDLIYDRDWPKYLGLAGLPDEDSEVIINWFQELGRLDKTLSSTTIDYRNLPNDITRLLKPISKIIEKYSNVKSL